MALSIFAHAPTDPLRRAGAPGMCPRRRSITMAGRWILVLAAAIVLCGSAAAADYPSKPVHIIVPFAPGGAGDVTARIVGKALSLKWGVPVVVEDHGGAGGNLGAGIAAQAEPNGYTLFELNVANAIAVSLYRDLSYDLASDFLPITELAASPMVLVATPGLHLGTVPEFLALARAHPGELNYGSSGPGSASHLLMETLLSAAGIHLTHIPYNASARLQSDLIAGRIDFTFATPSSAMPLIRSGRLVGLGVSSLHASSGLPAIAESGVPGFEGLTWLGLVAPAKTPAAIIARLNADVVAVLNDPEVRQRTQDQGLQPVGSSPDAFGAFIAAETEKWRLAVRIAGLTAQ